MNITLIFSTLRKADSAKKKANILFNFRTESIKTFLAEFCETNDDGKKIFKYAAQLTRLAHREQIPITIELDDLMEFNESMVEAIMANTRRYIKLFSDVIFELLPTYKEHSVVAKDSLDVFIEHRLMMAARMRNQAEPVSTMNQFPPELMQRLYVLHVL